MNQNHKLRRKWSPKRKLQIVMETLQSDAKLAEICRREGLSPTQVYQWRKTLMASGETLFVPKRKGAVRTCRPRAINKRVEVCPMNANDGGDKPRRS